jgi:nucleoside-diphosphate-sugar epimerase
MEKYAPFLIFFLLPPTLLFIYVKLNDRKLERIPPQVLAISPHRTSPSDAVQLARRLAALPTPLSVDDQLPPRTGRRYIVIGGAGFLGGWIVLQLLRRGEDPKRIRVLDIRTPTRSDLLEGQARDVDFVKCDVSDPKAVEHAFAAPWPASPLDGDDPNPETTVFHTAANIRFFERHASLVPRSANVNLRGTQNVLSSSLSIGASTLVYTSSGSVPIHSSFFLLWPWQKEPQRFVQAINDDDSLVPTQQKGFFSNYAYTKCLAERSVRDADKSPSGSTSELEGKRLRTGCIRPGNGIFGPGGDMLCGAYLVRKNNPSWIQTVVQNFVYVENCALAHLLYERRLIDIEAPPSYTQTNGDAKSTTASGRLPDIGGSAFMITDPCPPLAYGDVYTLLSTLTDNETTFPALSPTFMLLVAYIIEFLYLSKQLLLIHASAPSHSTNPIIQPFNALLRGAFRVLAGCIPTVGGDLVNLQPSLWNLTMVHLLMDDSHARLPPSQGGLGYRGGWTTLEGLVKTVEAHKEEAQKEGFHTRSGQAGVSLGLSWLKKKEGVNGNASSTSVVASEGDRNQLVGAQRGVARVGEKVREEIGVDPVVGVLSGHQVHANGGAA